MRQRQMAPSHYVGRLDQQVQRWTREKCFQAFLPAQFQHALSR
jgi:hypothetical protein